MFCLGWSMPGDQRRQYSVLHAWGNLFGLLPSQFGPDGTTNSDVLASHWSCYGLHHHCSTVFIVFCICTVFIVFCTKTIFFVFGWQRQRGKMKEPNEWMRYDTFQYKKKLVVCLFFCFFVLLSDCLLSFLSFQVFFLYKIPPFLTISFLCTHPFFAMFWGA